MKNDLTLKINDRKLNSETLFNEIERLMCVKEDLFLDTLFPLAEQYCGSSHPDSIMFFVLGAVAGILIEKEQIEIKTSNYKLGKTHLINERISQLKDYVACRTKVVQKQDI